MTASFESNTHAHEAHTPKHVQIKKKEPHSVPSSETDVCHGLCVPSETRHNDADRFAEVDDARAFAWLAWRWSSPSDGGRCDDA